MWVVFEPPVSKSWRSQEVSILSRLPLGRQFTAKSLETHGGNLGVAACRAAKQRPGYDSEHTATSFHYWAEEVSIS